MKTIVISKKGIADKALQFKEAPRPTPAEDEILIRVEYSGLNFADVMGRKGLYGDAPPFPYVPGYDVAGTVEETGRNVQNAKRGDRVCAFTRFGGYAEYALANAMATAKIPEGISPDASTALLTQFVTAYYCSAELVNLFEGDKVLIHAAAGGVGTALVQFALHKKCIVFATSGSDEKKEMLLKAGVQYSVNYRKENFAEVVKQHTNGKGVDVIFDSVGGKFVKMGIRSLNAGGRIVCYGASEMSSGRNIYQQAKTGLAFGFYHPAQFITTSKSLLGVNMLRIAEHKPQIIKRCLDEVIKLTVAGMFKPFVSKVFPASEIADAHKYLESRASTGKVVIQW